MSSAWLYASKLKLTSFEASCTSMYKMLKHLKQRVSYANSNAVIQVIFCFSLYDLTQQHILITEGGRWLTMSLYNVEKEVFTVKWTATFSNTNTVTWQSNSRCKIFTSLGKKKIFLFGKKGSFCSHLIGWHCSECERRTFSQFDLGGLSAMPTDSFLCQTAQRLWGWCGSSFALRWYVSHSHAAELKRHSGLRQSQPQIFEWSTEIRGNRAPLGWKLTAVIVWYKSPCMSLLR